jgi:hypothetical protein
VALLAVLVTVLSGCASQSAAASRVASRRPAHKAAAGFLSYSQMASVVAETMATNNRANASLDLSLLKTYEAGSALAIDAASYAESRKVTGISCAYAPFGLKVLQAATLGSGAYPQRFVVLGTTYELPLRKGCTSAKSACPTPDSLFEFERSGPASHWRIVLEPSADSGRIVDLATNGSSARSLTAAQAASAQRVPHAAAVALQSYGVTGRLGPLSAAEFTSKCWLLPSPRAAFEQYAKGGVSESQIYSPMSGEVSLPLAGGAALAIFVLGVKSTLVPASRGSSIDWISDPAADPVTALLPSGQYSRITERGQLELGAVTSARGGFRIIGAYTGVTSIAGVKGSSPGGSGSGGVLVSYPIG